MNGGPLYRYDHSLPDTQWFGCDDGGKGEPEWIRIRKEGLAVVREKGK